GIGALQGESDPLRPLGRTPLAGDVAGSPVAGHWQTITSPAELDGALAAAKAAGQPVLLDWYADWCISCKVIEREVFSAPAVASLLGACRLMRFDMRGGRAPQRARLDRCRLFGTPAVLFFGPGGEKWTDLRVVGEIGAAEFAERLQHASARL